MDKLTTEEMECALARYFNPRYRLIVPNVSWGLGIHECDLLVLTKSGYASEVEIKVTKADLVKDDKKRHKHHDHLNRIKYLYFAIPDYLKDSMDKIPEKAGVLIVSRNIDHKWTSNGQCNPFLVNMERSPKLWCETWGGVKCKPQALTLEQQFKIARLGAIRVWDLKEKIINMKGGDLK